MHRPTLACTFALAFALVGCSAAPSRGSRAQDSAFDFNQHMRFGRTELAVEQVAPTDRDAFAKRHREWGAAVRIADSELAGIRLVKDEEAAVMVRIAWYRMDDQELRNTVVKQTWRDNRGSWQLAGEERSEGAFGLLGDEVVRDAPVRRTMQYPTIRIGTPTESQ